MKPLMKSLLFVCATKVQVCDRNLEAAIRDVIEGYRTEKYWQAAVRTERCVSGSLHGQSHWHLQGMTI